MSWGEKHLERRMAYLEAMEINLHGEIVALVVKELQDRKSIDFHVIDPEVIWEDLFPVLVALVKAHLKIDYVACDDDPPLASPTPAKGDD